MNEHTRQSRAISVTVEEDEARIGELMRRAEAGERIEVTRDGRLVAELTRRKDVGRRSCRASERSATSS